MLIALGVFSQCGWFRIRWIRRCWLAAVVSIIGLWTGNLISLALIAGWSAEGIAWRLAPGLAAVVILALALPVVSKSNPYCNHLCPHGAIQQLIRPASESKRRLAIGPRWNRWLRRIPGSILVFAYLTVWAIPTTDLSSWEPFHAYLFQIAGWGSLCLAVFSLLVSASVPMAYCRWGCPTGRMIDYLRFSAGSGRLQLADMVAFGLLILVMARVWLFV
jgi:polyferredoxin